MHDHYDNYQVSVNLRIIAEPNLKSAADFSYIRQNWNVSIKTLKSTHNKPTELYSANIIKFIRPSLLY